MEKFTMNDIYNGYVIELRNGHRLFATYVNQNYFTKVFVYEYVKRWYYASCWDEDTLKFEGQLTVKDPKDFDIIKVYGLIDTDVNYSNANTTDLGGRRLLWERKEPKVIKMSQIRKAFNALGNEEIFIEVDNDV